MVYSPQIAVITPRAIPDNLFGYFAANQADAILWATGGSVLRPIQRFENSVATSNLPSYPAILFQQDVDATVYDEDTIGAEYTAIFLLMVESTVAATAVVEAKAYAKAITSMIVNCPLATLATNTGAIAGKVVALRPETQFDEIKTNDMQNDWMQPVIISAKFQLLAGYHS